MKAASFDYIRPESLAQVFELLNDTSIETRLIAGGQTLVPLMAMRLAQPARLVDIAGLDELSGIRHNDSSVIIGAGVRQRELERSDEIARDLPLLSAALPFIGHQQTRNRGTLGGSLCNADPTAEICLVAVTLEATAHVQSKRGSRQIRVGDLLKDAMETSLDEDECLIACEFPIWNAAHTGCGFCEVNARASDYAIVAATAQISFDSDGRCTRARAAVGGASPVAVRATTTEAALVGEVLTPALIEDAAHAVTPLLSPGDDVHASALYRSRASVELLARAIRSAATHAGVMEAST